MTLDLVKQGTCSFTVIPSWQLISVVRLGLRTNLVVTIFRCLFHNGHDVQYTGFGGQSRCFLLLLLFPMIQLNDERNKRSRSTGRVKKMRTEPFLICSRRSEWRSRIIDGRWSWIDVSEVIEKSSCWEDKRVERGRADAGRMFDENGGGNCSMKSAGRGRRCSTWEIVPRPVFCKKKIEFKHNYQGTLTGRGGLVDGLAMERFVSACGTSKGIGGANAGRVVIGDWRSKHGEESTL